MCLEIEFNKDCQAASKEAHLHVVGQLSKGYVTLFRRRQAQLCNSTRPACLCQSLPGAWQGTGECVGTHSQVAHLQYTKAIWKHCLQPLRHIASIGSFSTTELILQLLTPVSFMGTGQFDRAAVQQN